MKKQRKVEKDNRGVAIYARKSRITNKGDSIGVQFKQCADYAKKELGLDEDYEFLQYEDKGLSGYFSDRPDFQRMLHDVQDGKIKAIVCYKLDRVGRKTADLIRLMDFLEMYHVNLLICSNGINTASGLYKIFIQIFAVIAEFERDTLTERIVDNMMELAKDGRWLGGNTPMGFTVRRVTTGSGKGKSAYSYLESLPEEKRMVQRLYEIFRTTRSIQSTAKQMNAEGFHTPSGAAFNASTTRLVLRNPIYCTADKRSYDYFIDHDGNVFGDMIEFDGTHGLSAYNKTDQEKYEGSDSTFISPKYVQTIESKPVSEWIIAVGRHEGFIPSEQWIEVQELLDAIAEKYNRPHRKTNALLALCWAPPPPRPLPRARAPGEASGVPDLRHGGTAGGLAGRRGPLHPALRRPAPAGRRPPHRRHRGHRRPAAGRPPGRGRPGAGAGGEPGRHGAATAGPGPVAVRAVGHGAGAHPGAGRPGPRPQDPPVHRQRQRGAAGGGRPLPRPAGARGRHSPQR